jgi:hypothetical protein
MASDVIDHLTASLRDARDASARAYDREAALLELHGLALDVAARGRMVALTIEALNDSPKSPEERARLRSLIDRAFPAPPTSQEET